jgi:hypothetical protein
MQITNAIPHAGASAMRKPKAMQMHNDASTHRQSTTTDYLQFTFTHRKTATALPHPPHISSLAAAAAGKLARLQSNCNAGALVRFEKLRSSQKRR